MDQISADIEGIKQELNENFNKKISGALKQLGLLQENAPLHQQNVVNLDPADYLYSHGQTYALQPVDPNACQTPPRTAFRARNIIPRPGYHRY